MEEDFRLTADTLPDTQNAGSLYTQSQDVGDCQPPDIWGRLCPHLDTLSFRELRGDEYIFGRAYDNEIVVKKGMIEDRFWNTISKRHFKITKEMVQDSSGETTTIACLWDLSQNGTFVNSQQKPVGIGNKVILATNDTISVAKPSFIVYSYMSTTSFESACLPVELRNKYAVSRTLGTGACGEVKLVFSKTKFQRFAMKTISRSRNTYYHNSNDSEKILNEVRILNSLKHPFIIDVIEVVPTPSAVYIVLELMEGGELFDRIKRHDGLPEKQAKLIIYQVSLAVQYLHNRGITHRDLKPENILLECDKDITKVKVTDFGLSKLVSAQTMMTTFCGTPLYVAPEILKTNGRGTYTSQVDVWSLGVILYCTLSARLPFHETKSMSLSSQIINGMYKIPDKIQDYSQATDLIQKMMTVNPKKRITINDVLKHPWFLDSEVKKIINYWVNQNQAELANDENIDPKIKKLRVE